MNYSFVDTGSRCPAAFLCRSAIAVLCLFFACVGRIPEASAESGCMQWSDYHQTAIPCPASSPPTDASIEDPLLDAPRVLSPEDATSPPAPFALTPVFGAPADPDEYAPIADPQYYPSEFGVPTKEEAAPSIESADLFALPESTGNPNEGGFCSNTLWEDLPDDQEEAAEYTSSTFVTASTGGSAEGGGQLQTGSTSSFRSQSEIEKENRFFCEVDKRLMRIIAEAERPIAHSGIAGGDGQDFALVLRELEIDLYKIAQYPRISIRIIDTLLALMTKVSTDSQRSFSEFIVRIASIQTNFSRDSTLLVGRRPDFSIYKAGLVSLDTIRQAIEGDLPDSAKEWLVLYLTRFIGGSELYKRLPMIRPEHVPSDYNMSDRLEQILQGLYRVAEARKLTDGLELAIALAPFGEEYAVLYGKTRLPWKENILSAAAGILDGYRKGHPLQPAIYAVTLIESHGGNFVRAHISQATAASLLRFADDGAGILMLESEPLHGDDSLRKTSIAALFRLSDTDAQEVLLDTLISRCPEFFEQDGSFIERLLQYYRRPVNSYLTGGTSILGFEVIPITTETIERRADISRFLYSQALYALDPEARLSARLGISYFGLHLPAAEVRAARDELFTLALSYNFERDDSGLSKLLPVELRHFAPKEAWGRHSLIFDTIELIRVCGWTGPAHSEELVTKSLQFLGAHWTDQATANRDPIFLFDEELPWAKEKFSFTKFETAEIRVQWLMAAIQQRNWDPQAHYKTIQQRDWDSRQSKEVQSLFLPRGRYAPPTEYQKQFLRRMFIDVNDVWQYRLIAPPPGSRP